MFAQCNARHENDLKEVIKEIKGTEGGGSAMDVTRKNLQYHFTRRMRSLSSAFLSFIFDSILLPLSPSSLLLPLLYLVCDQRLLL